MDNFYFKDVFSQVDIDDIITNKIEENYYLEFKSAQSLINTDGAKK